MHFSFMFSKTWSELEELNLPQNLYLFSSHSEIFYLRENEGDTFEDRDYGTNEAEDEISCIREVEEWAGDLTAGRNKTGKILVSNNFKAGALLEISIHGFQLIKFQIMKGARHPP